MRAFPLVVVMLVGCNYGLDAPIVDGTIVEAAPDDEVGGEDPSSELPATAVGLQGKVYAISPDTMTVTEPPGLDGLFDEVLDRDVLVYVADESADTLSLSVALAGANGGQDPCEAVRAFPAGDWTQNPVFEVGPGRLDTRFAGHPAAFRDLELAGVFDEYAFAWRDGTLSAQLDTRELAPALGDIDDVCGLVEELGGTCAACDDGEPACFALRIEDIVAELADASFDPTPSSAGCG